MTQFVTANIGSYPRIGEEKDQQRHRRALANFDNKEISAHALKDVEQSIIQEAIREQISLGLDEVTDGLISWQDPISHFCKNVSGIRLAGFTRYFDTNFYYRRPLITSKPKVPVLSMVKEYEYAKNVSSKPVRVVLTGPYTLATHTDSESKNYTKLSSRIDFYCDVLKSELSAILKQDPPVIQIDEPALAVNPVDLPLAIKGWKKLMEGISSHRVVLGLFYGPLASLVDRLRDLPFSEANLDFSFDGNELMEKIFKNRPGLEIGFGVVDARNTVLENSEPITNFLRSYVEKFQPAVCRITPSSGLELVPRFTAQSKLNLLCKIKENFEKALAGEPPHG